jgi:serine/threonine-protein kinase RsbW
MKPSPSRTVKLDIASRFDMLEMVQTVLVHLSGLVGFDEEATHYMSVAVRESVVNAIKHGNRGEEARRVGIAFTLESGSIQVSVRDEGRGFDPEAVPNPTATENLLKVNGRGIFFMRSFMDDVSYAFPPGGGTVVTMIKRRRG